jgi:glycosyltransferase involved in cell wall biosynthesis
VNILFIVYNWVGQGGYWRARHFGQHLATRGHTVTAIATSRNRRVGIHVSNLDGVTLVEMPDLLTGSLRSGWDLWNMLNRIAWVRKRSFDITHVIQARPTALLPALYLKYARDVSLVMDWSDWFGRGGSVEERPNPVVRALLRPVETFFDERFRTCADGSVVICTTLHDKAIALGVPPETILLLPDGAETNRLHPTEHAEARRRLDLPLGVPIIGYIGSIFPRDAELMAHAFDLVCEWIPDVRLLVMGYCPIQIRQLVRTPEAIIQTGFIEEQYLNDYLASCDVCWLPLEDTNANRGRRPLKLNDYMAVGRPTVATSVGDVATLFNEEAIGLLAADKPEPFAVQTMRLLQDQDLRIAMGQHARQVAETRFSWVQLTDKLETFYRKVLDHRQTEH